MSQRVSFLAVDLGAESGRVFLGGFDGERVSVKELHRFPNAPVLVVDGLHWDTLRIIAEVKDGLKRAARTAEGLQSVGVDSWGVDFALLDRDGALVSNPHHYRDARTMGMIDRALTRASRREIYRTTGIQFIPLNTLFQLLAMENSPLLEAADTLLMIPDLINYWLTGEKVCEYTNATTTQLYGLDAGGWAGALIEKMRIPRRLFPGIVAPGIRLGGLLPEVGRETGLDDLSVVTVASHDTASAVVAVPAEGPFAYISSGTWSLVGMEVSRPVVTEGALRHNFTNEGGVGGTVRLLRNVMGLWLLQECRRVWAQNGRRYSYDELVYFAENAPPFGPLIEPDDPAFLPPGDMPARIRDFCKRTGQRPVEGPGEILRCIFESLALKYRWVLERAEEVSGQRAEAVHVVGGGAQNSLLCQLAAEATRRPVLAGPVEATVLGNIMLQAYARGDVGSLTEIRSVVRSSVELRAYTPRESADAWNEASARFLEFVDSPAERPVTK